jgi:TP901 family phage tail tape measure protein
MNLSSLIKITARTEGVQDVSNLAEGIAKLRQSTEEYNETNKEYANSKTEKSTIAKTAALVGLGASMFAASSSAVQFESSLADVRKVVDGLQTPAALSQISQEIVGLSREMPVTAKGFAEIYAAAGRSGVAKAELKDFAKQVAQVSIAFDMTAEEAGTAMGQIRSALGISLPELNRLMDALNSIDDSSGASAAGLVDFMTRVGATGKIAGLTAEQTAAFGATMMESGFQSEVAATSFRALINALSRGPSMTERQVEALKRLGYTMNDAKTIESELTRKAQTESKRRVQVAEQHKDKMQQIAEEQSQERLRIARDETDKLDKEISRRYRNELQGLEDSWNDQDEINESRLRDAAELAIKAIQREERARLNSLESQAKAAGASYDNEIDAIKESNEARIEQIRNALDSELKLQRRAARDRQQQARDNLEDRRQAEIDAANQRYMIIEKNEKRALDVQRSAADQRLEAVKEAEATLLKTQEGEAKKTGDALAKQSMQGFADRMQKDAIGTIQEVFMKINKLPKAQQLSVMTDLFGDEARGIVPMINNLERFKQILSVASNEVKNSGSVSREYGIRSQTTANQLQLFQNAIESLKIALGDALLTVLTNFLYTLTPLVNGLASITKSLQGVITYAAKVTGFSIIFKTAAGPIITIATLLASVWSLGTLAKWGAGLKILAFMPGPLRLVAAGLAAVGLAASPLGPIINAIVIGLTALQAIQFAGNIIGSIAGIKLAFGGLVTWITTIAIPALIAFIASPLGLVAIAIAIVAAIVVWRKEIGAFFVWVGKGIGDAVKGITFGIQFGFGILADWFNKNVTSPLSKLWNSFTTLVVGNLQKAGNFVKGIWDTIVKNVTGAVNAIASAIRSLLRPVIGAVNTAIRGFNSVSGRVSGFTVSEIPAFAQGGVVTRPTMALLGDGGEPEYVVPKSKAAGFATRYLQGEGRSAAGGGGSFTAPSINITTGPVQQDQTGQRWATVEDVERVAVATRDGTLALLRNPQARRALGMA